MRLRQSPSSMLVLAIPQPLQRPAAATRSLGSCMVSWQSTTAARTIRMCGHDTAQTAAVCTSQRLSTAAALLTTHLTVLQGNNNAGHDGSRSGDDAPGTNHGAARGGNSHGANNGAGSNYGGSGTSGADSTDRPAQVGGVMSYVPFTQVCLLQCMQFLTPRACLATCHPMFQRGKVTSISRQLQGWVSSMQGALH